LSFRSQTAETHARAPRIAVHVPPGTWIPFDVFGWQTPVPLPARSSHQLPVPHSASVKQAFPHAPVATLQKAPELPGPPHCASETHFPHVPPVHVGFALEEHGSVVEVPLSPLQTTHVFVVASQTGVRAEQVVADTHWTQSPLSGPLVAQIVERQTVPPFPLVHGPSPFA